MSLGIPPQPAGLLIASTVVGWEALLGFLMVVGASRQHTQLLAIITLSVFSLMLG
ncbi:MAG: hypothetical protein ACR2GY_02970 [Phycisphaerales bacterium]